MICIVLMEFTFTFTEKSCCGKTGRIWEPVECAVSMSDEIWKVERGDVK
jgi:hypothetical protein